MPGFEPCLRNTNEDFYQMRMRENGPENNCRQSNQGLFFLTSFFLSLSLSLFLSLMLCLLLSHFHCCSLSFPYCCFLIQPLCFSTRSVSLCLQPFLLSRYLAISQSFFRSFHSFSSTYSLTLSRRHLHSLSLSLLKNM